MTLREEILAGGGVGTAQQIAAADLVPEALHFAGVEYQPDESTAYLRCRLSHAFPVVTYYGDCLAAQTVARSYKSFLHKPLNRDHLMRSYDPQNITRDRIVGAVVAASWTGGGFGRAEVVPESVEASPGVDCLCALFKRAEWVDTFLGKQQAGRLNFAVSMEVRYRYDASGFLVGGSPLEDMATPDAWRQAGWSYVPFDRAPDGLLASRDWKRNRMASAREGGQGFSGTWEGRPVWWLMGGLAGQVHYAGIGVVRVGAEPTATITQVTAENEEMSALLGWLDEAARTAETLVPQS